MERQKHGFTFQDMIKEQYLVELSENYTDRWDGKLNGLPVSIKCEKNGSDIELADLFRNSTIDEDFYMFVGFWEGNKDNIVDVQILLVKHEEWRELFDNDCSIHFKEMLKNITNNRTDDEKWKKMMKEGKKMWQEKTPNLIRPRFKRDHKSQKRIQCAINYADFFNYFVHKYGIKL